MICLSDTEPCEEVVSWLRRNQDKHEITIITRESLGKNELLPEEFIVKTSQFPNYHVLKAGHIDDIEQEETEDDESTLQTKKRKQDKDSSCIDLPRDLGGEVLKNGRTALNQDVTHMVDSNGLLNAANADTLYKQFTEHGYLYFKGLLNKSEVIDAQLSITEILHKLGAVDDQLHSISSTGWTVNTQSGSFVSGKNDFSDSDGTEELWRQAAQHPNLEAISHHKLLKLVLTLLARGKSNHEKCPYAPKRLSNDYSWLRVKAPNEYTNVNASILYYKSYLPEMFEDPDTTEFDAAAEGSCEVCQSTEDDAHSVLCDECYRCYHTYCAHPELPEVPKGEWFCEACRQRPVFGTCWVPLGDTPADQGALAVVPGTQTLPDYYKLLKVKNSQISASYYRHGKNLTWHSGSFEAGDVVFFDSHLVSCTSKNRHSTFGLTLDFAWSMAPVGRMNFGQTYQSMVLNKISTDFSSE